MLMCKRNNWKAQKGFALIMVLMGLLTLTLLHTMIVQRTLQNSYGIATELTLVEKTLDDAFLIDFILQNDIETIGDKSVRLGNKEYSLRAINVSGLVDLLTADDVLRETLLTSLSVDAAKIPQILNALTLKNFGNDKRKAFEFVHAKLVQNSEETPILATLATVYSGQTFVSPDYVPDQLSTLLADYLSLRDYSTSLRSANWHVFVSDARWNRMRFLAVIHVPGGNQSIRVLR